VGLEPVLGFIDDPNSGMWQSVMSHVNFSTAGAQRLQISNTELLVGVSGGIVGLKRASVTPANSWEDGCLGNSEALIFVPSDFVSDTSGVNISVGFSDIISNPPSGWIGVITDGSGGISATKIIPKGFTIDGSSTVIVYTPQSPVPDCGLSVSGRIATALSELAAAPTLLVGSTTYSTNSALFVQANTLVGDGNMMVTLWFKSSLPVGGTGQLTFLNNNVVSGAKITMSRI